MEISSGLEIKIKGITKKNRHKKAAVIPSNNQREKSVLATLPVVDRAWFSPG